MMVDDDYRSLVNSDRIKYESYLAVNEMDLDTYTNTVLEVYEEAVDRYNEHLDTQAEAEAEQAAKPLKHMIAMRMEKCNRAINRINLTLGSGVLDTSLNYDSTDLW